MPHSANKISRFWQEMKRRKVIRVVTVYAAAAFVVLELVDILAPSLRLPDWTLNLVLILLCVGFVITVILSWIYDIHPEGGIVKTEPAHRISESESPVTSRGWKIATFISFVVILGLVVLNIIPRIKTPELQVSSLSSIAVLPFEDMSPDKDQEYFCDGITDEIINTISHIDGLKVIARTSTFAFKGQHEDIREIGKQLDVETILEGSIQKMGNRIRIIAQLVKTEDGSHIWSERYDREMEDLFRIQDEISQSIADNLKTGLLGSKASTVANRQTGNLEAYNLYLQGRYFWHRRTEEDQKKSIEYFNRAIQLDSNYALAYAGLADAYFIMAWWNFYPGEDGYSKAEEYALKALSINDDLSEAHATLGGVATWYDWDWKRAENELKTAITLNPNDANAHQYYSELLDILDRDEEAREQIDLAIRLNPSSYIMHLLSGMCYLHTSDYEYALEQFQKADEFSGSAFPNVNIFICYAELAQENKAIASLIENVSYLGLNDANQLLNEIYRNEGMTGIFQWYIEWALEKKYSSYFIASLYAMIGERVKAIELLEKGFEMGESNLPRINNNPDFDIIRDDPRFQALLRKMGLAN